MTLLDCKQQWPWPRTAQAHVRVCPDFQKCLHEICVPGEDDFAELTNGGLGFCPCLQQKADDLRLHRTERRLQRRLPPPFFVDLGSLLNDLLNSLDVALFDRIK